MSITKFIALAAVAATTTCAFADARDTRITFYTESDTYADGTPVKDGEWYACCWSADGVFEGITTDYKPLDPNDKVYQMRSRAKNGRCPNTLFTIASAEAPKNGKFCVIMLDTREGGKGAVAGSVVVEGKEQPERSSNAAIACTNYKVSTVLGSTPKGAAVANAGWGATDPKPETPAKIVAINPAGDDVVIEIDNLYPGVRYNLKAGSAPDKLTSYALEIPVSGADATTEPAAVILPKNEAKFYKLVTEPMTK